MDQFFGSLTHHDPRDLGLICVVKKRRISDSFRVKNPIFDFVKERHP